MKIILIGFMGAGKTAVAELLATTRRWPLIDIDQEVLEKSGERSINDIFSKHGEAYFRDLEHACCLETGGFDRCVIATGGGVVENSSNISALGSAPAKIVWLKVSFEAVLDRLRNDQSRPLFQNLTAARELYDKRQPLYAKYANLILDSSNAKPEELVLQILNSDS